MATAARRVESREPFLTFLAQELAPREGRGLAVARIAAACTITVIIATVFRIPLAAYMAYMVFLTSKDDIAGTSRMAVAGTLAITLGVIFSLSLAQISLGDPAVRLPGLVPHRRDVEGGGFSIEFLAMTYGANGYSNDGTLSHRGCATSDVTPSSHVSDECLSERDRQDCSDMLSSLLAAAAVALNTNRRVTQRCIQRAAVLLGINVNPGADGTAGRSCLQGGLASWQAKRLTSYIEDKLDSTIRVSDLAGLVRLSSAHFSRTFQETFGETPFAYVMKRRMVRAQQLMLTSRVPLSQVALACGMCDQAHFSRTFRRIVGTNPGTWRRQFLLDTGPGEHASAAGPSATLP